MTFLFCGFIFDSSDEEETTRKSQQQQNQMMPVQSSNYSWLPEPAKINLKSSTTCNAWMSPYTRNQGCAAETPPTEHTNVRTGLVDPTVAVSTDDNRLLHNLPTNITPNPGSPINNNLHLNHQNIHNNLHHHHINFNHNNNNNNRHNNNNNHNNGSDIVILDGCRPPSATTARRFLKWFSRIGQPPTEKSDGPTSFRKNLIFIIFCLFIFTSVKEILDFFLFFRLPILFSKSLFFFTSLKTTGK